jgi:phage terminase small subunit
MTPRQTRFVEEYARLKNGRQAAIAAGYAESCADAMASRCLRHPDVMAALKDAGVELAGHRCVLPALSMRQQRFVDHYLTLDNAAEAARRAGYAARSAKGSAYHLLRLPQVAAAVAHANEERAAKTRVTAERVMTEWARLGFADLVSLLDVAPDGSVAVKPFDRMTGDERAAVSEITVQKDGAKVRVKVKIFNKNRALAALGRHFGLDKKQSHSNYEMTAAGAETRAILAARVMEHIRGMKREADAKRLEAEEGLSPAESESADSPSSEG